MREMYTPRFEIFPRCTSRCRYKGNARGDVCVCVLAASLKKFDRIYLTKMLLSRRKKIFFFFSRPTPWNKRTTDINTRHIRAAVIFSLGKLAVSRCRRLFRTRYRPRSWTRRAYRGKISRKPPHDSHFRFRPRYRADAQKTSNETPCAVFQFHEDERHRGQLCGNHFDSRYPRGT
ncbi:hypothetical protein PUN28_014665 [Cardiocondyla obscurior]|uniref:Uncharacterized protein n=1 Tax=Cardiocondyla obscurior TaxID=286306 RepID=A0AAW2EXC8_9HYME